MLLLLLLLPLLLLQRQIEFECYASVSIEFNNNLIRGRELRPMMMMPVVQSVCECHVITNRATTTTTTTTTADLMAQLN